MAIVLLPLVVLYLAIGFQMARIHYFWSFQEVERTSRNLAPAVAQVALGKVRFHYNIILIWPLILLLIAGQVLVEYLQGKIK